MTGSALTFWSVVPCKGGPALYVPRRPSLYVPTLCMPDGMPRPLCPTDDFPNGLPFPNGPPPLPSLYVLSS